MSLHPNRKQETNEFQSLQTWWIRRTMWYWIRHQNFASVRLLTYSIEHSFTVECDDGSVKEDSGYIAYMDTLREGLKRLGTSAHLFSPAFFRQHLEEAGFVDVEVYTYKVPWGAWPKNKKSKEIGRFCQEVFTSGMPVLQSKLNGECLRIIIRRRGVCVTAYDPSFGNAWGQG